MAGLRASDWPLHRGQPVLAKANLVSAGCTTASTGYSQHSQCWQQHWLAPIDHLPPSADNRARAHPGEAGRHKGPLSPTDKKGSRQGSLLDGTVIQQELGFCSPPAELCPAGG